MALVTQITRRSLLGGAATINPMTLPFMELRLSGTALAGADDSNISSWTDSSGNGRTASQGSATPQPHVTIQGNANVPYSPTGRKGAAFNFGENDNMAGSMPASPGTEVARGFTFYAWFNESPFGTTNQTLWQENNSLRLIVADGSSKIGFGDKNGVHASGTSFTSGNHFMVWIFYPPVGSGTARIYQDGRLLLEYAGWDTTNQHGIQDGYTVGNNVATTTPWAGSLYDLIVFSNAHPLSLIQAVRNWGKGFWGI